MSLSSFISPVLFFATLTNIQLTLLTGPCASSNSQLMTAAVYKKKKMLHENLCTINMY